MCALQRAYNMLREVLFFKELPLVWLDLGKNMDSLSFGGPIPSFTSMWSLDSLQPLPRIYLVSLRKASVEPRSLYS